MGSPTAGSTSPAPGRRAATPALRRSARTVLILGSAFAAMAAFGPTWASRVGVTFALTAAVVACVLAWREIAQARRAHAHAMLADSRQHGQALRAERTHNASVLDTLAQRSQAAGAEISRHQTVVAGLKGQVSTLRGDNSFLRSEVTHRESVICALRDTVRVRESELMALREGGHDAEIHALPRRALVDHAPVGDAFPGADERWSDGSHPTVVELVRIDTAMVLPNYEEDRRLA